MMLVGCLVLCCCQMASTAVSVRAGSCQAVQTLQAGVDTVLTGCSLLCCHLCSIQHG